MARKKSVHYVDNKKFLEAITCWRENCQDAEEAGDEVPPLTNYIGECFLKIATHLSYKPNFINYDGNKQRVLRITSCKCLTLWWDIRSHPQWHDAVACIFAIYASMFVFMST